MLQSQESGHRREDDQGAPQIVIQTQPVLFMPPNNVEPEVDSLRPTYKRLRPPGTFRCVEVGSICSNSVNLD